MNILITGANGFIGSNLFKFLNKRKDVTSIIGIDNFSSNFHRNLCIEHINISQSEDWAKLKNQEFDVIYHCAASFANELSVDYPIIDFNTNALGTLLSLEYAVNHKCKKFIYLASSSSYGGDEGSLPFKENDKLFPLTPYAISKHIGEMYCNFYQSNIDIYQFRLFNVYGPGDYPGKYRNAIPNMICKANDKKEITVFGKDSTRDFTYIDDVIFLLSQVIEDNIRPDIYNICTMQETKITDIVNFITNEFENISVMHKDRRNWDNVIRRVGSNEKIITELNLQNYKFVSVKEGIERTIRWMKTKVFTGETI